jgi:autotransporter-associated beta strand protein
MRRIRRSLSAACLEPIPAGSGAGLSDKVTTTPLLVQDGFGYGGAELPADGLTYCGPTAVAMSLLWLGKNGWNQIGPAAPTQPDALDLDLLLAGLADTAPLGGTNADNLQKAVVTYLSAAGIPSSAFTYQRINQPSVETIAQLNQNQTVVTLMLGWYTPGSGSNTYQRIGGHFVAILGQQQPNPEDLTIGNPCPGSLGPVPDLPAFALQTLPTSNFTGTSGDLPVQPNTYYLQFPDVTWSGWTQAVTPVLEAVFALTVAMSEQSRNGPTAALWALDMAQTIDTNGASFIVLAPLAGAGGLVKQGDGALTLRAANTTTGPNQIAGGSLTCTEAGTFGAGGIAMSGGALVVDPGGTGAEVALAVAGGQKSQFSFSGSTALQLAIGDNTSLAVTLGGPTSGDGPGLVQTGPGALMISVDVGAATLGAACTLTVPAGIGNLASSSIVPSIVAQSPQSAGALDFLIYGESGFVPPSYTSSTQTSINSATALDVYSVDNPQTLQPGATASVFALKAGPYEVSAAGANAVLKVGPQQAGETAGVILNDATFTTGFELDLGASDAAIYASGSAVVEAVISGSGQLIFCGPGTLSLTGANLCTGSVLVLSGTLGVNNVVGSGSATGTGQVTVQGAGILSIEGTVSGAISAEDGATVILQSGSAASSLDVDDQSILAGMGSVAGSATIEGQILAGSTPGSVQFQGDVTITGTTIFAWTLFDLEDNFTVGQSPQWNSLSFTTASIGQQDNGITVILDMTKLGSLDPNSDDEFWTSSHTWTLFQTKNAFNGIWYQLLQPQFRAGYFSLSNDTEYNVHIVYLNFTPFVPPLATRA